MNRKDGQHPQSDMHLTDKLNPLSTNPNSGHGARQQIVLNKSFNPQTQQRFQRPNIYHQAADKQKQMGYFPNSIKHSPELNQMIQPMQFGQNLNLDSKIQGS